MILRATRPPATSRAPAPSANNDAPPAPPVLGSSALGAGAGAGGGGGGAGVALGAGGGGGGGGVQGALATTPPAVDWITPSVQSASALAPPAVAVLALASATTAGSLWARAIGAAATRATASIAASNINFFNASYLLLKGSLCIAIGGGPQLLGPASSQAELTLYRCCYAAALGSRRSGLVDLLVTGGRRRRADREVAAIFLL